MLRLTALLLFAGAAVAAGTGKLSLLSSRSVPQELLAALHAALYYTTRSTTVLQLTLLGCTAAAVQMHVFHACIS
jgi:hypothetical protein